MKRLLLLLINLCLTIPLWAQNKSIDDKITPYDLMSEYYQKDFSPFKKGNIYTGFAFSLTTKSSENVDYLVYQIGDGKEKKYDLTFKTGYFMSDCNSIGLEGVYARDEFVGNVALDGESMRRERISSGGTIRPVLTTYFPLTKNNRLSFYNKVGLGFSFGSALTRNTSEEGQISKSYENNFGFSAGISPGVTFFLMENFALEIELQNLLGYNYELTETTTNGEEVARQHMSNVAFDIDLFSLRLGIAYYINVSKKAKKHRKR